MASRRDVAKLLAAAAGGFALGSAYRLPQLLAQSQGVTISEYYRLPASAIVFRDGEYAVAIDDKGQIIDKSTDHAEVINNALDMLRQRNYPYGYGVLKVVGEIELTSTVNLTGFLESDLVIDLRGSRIYPKINGDIVFDLTGSNNGVKIIGGYIYVPAGYEPKACFFLARKDSGSYGGHTFRDIRVWGSFTDAVVYTYASEGNTFINCFFRNEKDNGKVIMWTKNNPLGYKSKFTTTATGSYPNSFLIIIGGALNAAGSGGVPIEIYGGAQYVDLFGTWLGSNAGDSYILLNELGAPYTGPILLSGVKAQERETTANSIPDYAIHAVGSAPVRNVRIVNSLFRVAKCGIYLESGVEGYDIEVDRSTFWELHNDYVGTFRRCRMAKAGFIEDWGDGKYSEREGYESLVKDAFLVRTRPEWTVVQGTPTVSAGKLTLPSGNALIYTHSRLMFGKWSWRFQFATAPSSGSEYATYFAYEDDDNYFKVAVTPGGAFKLTKREEGTGVDLISSTWPVDTAEHLVEVTIDIDGNIELKLDGTSKGTATDTFKPISSLFRIINGLDQPVDIWDIKCY